MFSSDVAAEDNDVAGAERGEELQDHAELSHVRTGQDGEPDAVGVLLQCWGDNLLRGLVQV